MGATYFSELCILALWNLVPSTDLSQHINLLFYFTMMVSPMFSMFQPKSDIAVYWVFIAFSMYS